MGFKDLFSAQSADYARFRPRYPEELFEALARLAPRRELAWDCGTGNGQAAGSLAKRFKTVIATDPSRKQLESAEPHPGVAYALCGAERAPVSDSTCDLVTAAQAFHWFDQPAFFREAKRVLRPGGAIAIWCYNLCHITPEVDAVVHELYEGILGPYWEPERRQVEQGYSQAEFPFRKEELGSFEMRQKWELGHLVGYLGTWSSLHAYVRGNAGANPLVGLIPRLAAAWGEEKSREARWEILIRAGRKD
jgi:SAM-dependent methyltransferase